ncbi:hypothetical protein ACHAWF_002549 [Thalassiosira exigua]
MNTAAASSAAPATAAAAAAASTPSGDPGSSSSAAPSSFVEPLGIGDACRVLWRDGTAHLTARIVERRRDPSRGGGEGGGGKRGAKTAGGGGEPAPKRMRTEEEGLAAEDFLYYIHYEEHDRRLDEWVPSSRFELSSLRRLPPPPDPGAEGTGIEGGAGRAAGAGGGGPEASSGRRSSRRGGSADGRREGSSRRRSAGALASSADDVQGAGGGIGESGVSPSDAILRGGGNWHGNSGNPELAELEAEHHEITKVKNVGQIVMGRYLVEAWYYSPFPAPYHVADTLYVCEFCLKYMRKPKFFARHCAECPRRCPPGDEIYREGRLSVYELDGKDHRVYCQNLCLLAKLFLDHKTLYYDVDPFRFYVVTEVDDEGAHVVGYFSKEKVSAEDYNLACILTFPQYQKCGYGKFIIDLSYALSRREGRPGSPEKPLSDLGKISYRSYWTHVLLTLFAKQKGEENVQIKEISVKTGIKTEDIISTLQSLNMIRFWKGQHVVFVMQDFLKKYAAQKKKIRLCDEKCLSWVPHSERKKGGGSD